MDEGLQQIFIKLQMIEGENSQGFSISPLEAFPALVMELR